MYPHPGDPLFTGAYAFVLPFLYSKYHQLPSVVADLLSPSDRHKEHIKKKECYLNQNGGEKVPGIESSFHLG